MDPIDLLPDAPLTDAGMISTQFACLGIATFREACGWVRDLTYGSNTGSYPDVIFEDKRGTCRSKHSAIAALARELGLAVSQYVGAYRLDESIVEGVRPLLAANGLTYVPQIHCVLKYDERFFDLTAGNCHGKKKDVTEMDVYFQVNPSASDDEHRAVYALCVQYYQRTDPALARMSVEEIRHIARACSLKTRLACAVA